jgi:hypothetical protein
LRWVDQLGLRATMRPSVHLLWDTGGARPGPRFLPPNANSEKWIRVFSIPTSLRWAKTTLKSKGPPAYCDQTSIWIRQTQNNSYTSRSCNCIYSPQSLQIRERVINPKTLHPRPFPGQRKYLFQGPICLWSINSPSNIVLISLMFIVLADKT